MENRQDLRRALGRWGEGAALRYLQRKRYRIIEHGVRLLGGEIDIIAYDRRTLVFIEVKTRTGSGFGLPEESVTVAKQVQLRKIAQAYLHRLGQAELPCRFDVISLTSKAGGRPVIRHIKDAF